MRIAIASAAALLLLAAAALAERFTPYTNSLRTEIENRSAILGEPADRVGRRLQAAYGKALEELGRDTFTLEEDLKSADRATKTLLKAEPEDEFLRSLCVNAATAFRQATGLEIGNRTDAVEATADSPKRTKMLGLLEAAEALREKARLELQEADPPGGYRFLKAAHGKMRAVQKYLNDIGE